MATTAIMQTKDNVSHIQLFGRLLPSEGRIATKEEETLIKQWIREAFQKGESENEIQNKNLNIDEGKIVVHLINYPIKESPMVIQSCGEKIQLTDPVGTIHILEQNQLRNFVKRLDS